VGEGDRLIVVGVHPGQLFSGRSRAIVTFAVAYVVVVVVVVALAPVFVPAELVAQQLTLLEPFAGMDSGRRLAAAVDRMQTYAGADVMKVVGEMGLDMIVVGGQSLSVEKTIVGFDEDWRVLNLIVEVVVESHNHRPGNYMAVLKLEMAANYTLEILDMDKALEGGLVVVVQGPFAVVLTCKHSALEPW
jgi:hypothetical protein